MLRAAVAALLRGDGVMRATLPGGIWPEDGDDPSALSAKHYPAAFDAIGNVLPTALVRDDGAFPFGGGDRTASVVFRLLVWQQTGRAAIDAALARADFLLTGATVNVGAPTVYRIEYAGAGPDGRDPALADAEIGWSRWQAIVLK